MRVKFVFRAVLLVSAGWVVWSEGPLASRASRADEAPSAPVVEAAPLDDGEPVEAASPLDDAAPLDAAAPGEPSEPVVEADGIPGVLPNLGLEPAETDAPAATDAPAEQPALPQPPPSSGKAEQAEPPAPLRAARPLVETSPRPARRSTLSKTPSVTVPPSKALPSKAPPSKALPSKALPSKVPPSAKLPGGEGVEAAPLLETEDRVSGDAQPILTERALPGAAESESPQQDNSPGESVAADDARFDAPRELDWPAPPVKTPTEPAPSQGSTPRAGPTWRPLSFQGVTPGETTSHDVLQTLGEAQAQSLGDNGVVYQFQIAPWKRVAVACEGGIARRVVVELTRAAPTGALARDIGLTAAPAALPRADGLVIGQFYPEQGATLLFAAGTLGAMSHTVLLEPVRAEAFALRAQHDFARLYTRDLADLDQALALDPGLAAARRLKAKLLWRLGRGGDARRELDALGAPARRTPAANLLAAQWLLEQRDFAAARALLDELRKQVDAASPTGQVAKASGGDNAAPSAAWGPETIAELDLREGDWRAAQDEPDWQAALEAHTRAARRAAERADAEEFAIRRAAKTVLIEAHLAIAADLVGGPWAGKRELVARWLRQATTLADDFAADDQGDPDLCWLARQQTWHACAALREPALAPPDPVALLPQCRAALAAAADPLRGDELRWRLGWALYEAGRAHEALGKADAALRCGEVAEEWLEQAAEKRELTPALQYLLGRCHYHLGELYAANSRASVLSAVPASQTANGSPSPLEAAHALAAARTHQARCFSLMRGAAPRLSGAQGQRAGELLVALGAACWKTGDTAQGLAATELGAACLERAAGTGATSESLAAAYGNLAVMRRKLGQTGAAEEARRKEQHVRRAAAMLPAP